MFLPELDERFAGDDVHGLLISQIEMFGKGEILLMNELPDLPHHRGQIPHNLIIPKADHPQPQRGQNLLSPVIFVPYPFGFHRYIIELWQIKK